MKRILLSTVLSFALCGSLLASDENRWYMGASIGQSEADTEISAETASLDEDDTAWKIFGGYKFNQYFATEFFYADLGEASLTGDNGDTFSTGGTDYAFTADGASIVTDAKTIGISIVGSYPVYQYFEPFAKVGFHRWDIDFEVGASTLGSASTSDDGTDIMYGLGFDIPINDNFVVRAEWERYELDEYNEGDFLSAGLIYKF